MLTDRPPRAGGTRGFVLFIVITVLLLVAILAFSFSALKSGTIEQLGKNIDQNRLALIAQAANNEALAFFKTEVNRPGTQAYTACRKDIFDLTRPAPSLPLPLYIAAIDESHTLPSTKSIAESVPAFDIKVKTNLSVIVTKRVNTIRMNAFIGHLEIVSQARDRFKNSIEIKERRDLKLVDLRDFFDKYVLYVKNYGFDYNQPSRSLIVNGLPPGKTNFADGTYSRIYLGNRFHPQTGEAADIGGERNLPIHFDFDVEHSADKKLLAELLGLGTALNASFNPLDPGAKTMAQQKTFWVLPNPVDFKNLPAINKTELYQHPQIVKLYLQIVKAAQDAANSADPGAKGRSVAGAIISDYGNANGTDYSPCQVFQGCVQTFIDNWKYHYGFTDAARLWKLESATREPQDFLTFLPFSGLSTYASGYSAGTPAYNSERFRIGRMAKLFGRQGDRLAMVEGNCYLRFFKVAFFDEFTAKLKAIVPHWGMSPTDSTIDFSIPTVPLDFVVKPQTSHETFLHKVRPVDGSTWNGKPALKAADGLEGPLMSRAIDNLPFNRLLLPEQPRRTKLQPAGTTGPAQKENYDPKQGVAPYPEQKGNNGVPTPGENFFPVVDPPAFSFFYKNSQAFLEERATDEGGGKVLHLDGRMFIESGDLHLEDIRSYRGLGTIVLGKGHCFIGTLKRSASTTLGPSTLRIFLQKGDFVVSGGSDVEIQASLIATTWCDPASGLNPASRDNQGKLLCNQKNVRILGNLVVDYLFTESDSTGSGLKNGGELVVTHDEEIYDPTVPVRISVGSVRTSYCMNAGGSTF